MEKKYYKAKLFTCDKDLKFLKKGTIKYSEIYKHLNDENVDLIIEDDGEETIEYRVKEQIPLLYFDKVVISSDYKGAHATVITEEFIANLNKDDALMVAICFKTKFPEITKEEADKLSENIDPFELQASLHIALNKAKANLTKKEQEIQRRHRYIDQFRI